MRFVGIDVVNSVLSNKFPRELSARTISWVLPFGVDFKNKTPIPLSLKLPSFLTKTLHLKQNAKNIYIIQKFINVTL